MLVDLVSKYSGKSFLSWTDNDKKTLDSLDYVLEAIPGGFHIIRKSELEAQSVEKEKGSNPLFESFSFKIEKYSLGTSNLRHINNILSCVSNSLYGVNSNPGNSDNVDEGCNFFRNGILDFVESYLESNEAIFTDSECDILGYIASLDENISRLNMFESDIEEGNILEDKQIRLDEVLNKTFSDMNFLLALVMDKEQLRQEYLNEFSQFEDVKVKVSDYVSQFLGYDDIGAKCMEANNLEEIVSILKNPLRTDLPDGENYFQIMDSKDSDAIKGIKALHKEARNELSEFAEFIFPSYCYLKPLEKQLKSAIKSLGKFSDVLVEEEFSFDSSFNPELDYKTSDVSNDCTIMPLPFYHHKTHNIKVYEGKKHVGNIYAVECDYNNGENISKVLHLDAIQIPNYNFKTIKKLMDKFIPELYSKVGMAITVNDSLSQVSNHFPIQQVISKYSANIILIDYPNINLKENFQNFQGFIRENSSLVSVIYDG